MKGFIPKIGAVRLVLMSGTMISANPGTKPWDNLEKIANEWWDGEAWLPYKRGDLQVHTSPKYEPCEHEWPNNGVDVKDSDCCVKCGMSFVRYVFTEAP